MTLKIDYDTAKILFDNYLEIVRSIKFTPKEAEVIACIVNNRGDKKVAEILSMKPTTASVHTNHINKKIRRNSKDGIIDFIESSGKLKLFKQYYYPIILIKNACEKQLDIFKDITSDQQYNIFYSCSDNQEQIQFCQALKNDLAKANINLVTGVQDNNLSNKNSIKIEGDYTNVINAFNRNEYYFEVIKLASRIIGRDNIYQMAKDFGKYYSSVVESTGDINLNSLKKEVVTPTNRSGTYIAVLIIFITTLVASYLFASNIIKYNHSKSIDIKEVHQQLSNFVEKFSTNNLYKKQQLNNFNLIIELENTVEPLLLIKSENELAKLQFTDKELVDFVYMLSVLSSYYLFNKHDWEKARELLLFSNQLIQSYINKRITIPLELNKLDDKEIYTELSMVRDLPEIYTHILYFLGRTYIYENKTAEKGLEYFYKVEQLGKKLNLFDSYLSVRSGIGVIKLEQIKLLLKNNSKDAQIKSFLLELIELYKKIRDDNNSYIVNYNPRSINQNYIMPSKDLYNQIECTQRIIQGYKYLINIENNKKKQSIYADIILQNFVGESGLLSLISNSNLHGRKVALIYNLLGGVLLELYDKKIECLKYQALIEKNLKFQKEDILDLIHNIFAIGKEHSSNMDFTKADSYSGMIEVINKKLQRDNLGDQQKLEFRNNLIEYTTQRNKINESLKRKQH